MRLDAVDYFLHLLSQAIAGLLRRSRLRKPTVRAQDFCQRPVSNACPVRWAAALQQEQALLGEVFSCFLSLRGFLCGASLLQSVDPLTHQARFAHARRAKQSDKMRSLLTDDALVDSIKQGQFRDATNEG